MSGRIQTTHPQAAMLCVTQHLNGITERDAELGGEGRRDADG
jgi:hypothetical protein